MRQLFKLICLLSIWILLGSHQSAQAVEKELLCPIIHLETLPTGYKARLHCGREDGMFDQSEVKYLFQRYVTGGKDSLSYRTQKMTLKQIGEWYSELEIQVSSERKEQLENGDFVAVNVDVPHISPTQNLFRLSLLGIIFKEQSNQLKPWVQYRDYLRQPDYDFQKERLNGMLAEIHEIAEYADQVAGTDPVPGGRFAGLTLKEAMLKSTKADFIDFFEFVEAFPGKYIGYNWNFPEVYATWIINKAPGPDDKNIKK